MSNRLILRTARHLVCPPFSSLPTSLPPQVGVANHLILALDEETKKWCEEHGINAYLLALQVHKSQEGTGEARGRLAVGETSQSVGGRCVGLLLGRGGRGINAYRLAPQVQGRGGDRRVGLWEGYRPITLLPSGSNHAVFTLALFVFVEVEDHSGGEPSLPRPSLPFRRQPCRLCHEVRHHQAVH